MTNEIVMTNAPKKGDAIGGARNLRKIGTIALLYSGIRHSSFVIRISLSFTVLSARAALDESKLPPPANATVDFARDILPVFESTCWRCHGPERPKGHFRLDNRELALKGGDNKQEDLVPGDSAKSTLIHYVERLVEDMEMPPPGKGEPLTTEPVGVLRSWIGHGACWPSGS